MLATDRRPGEILALGLISNAPHFLAFVLTPLVSGGDPQAGRAYVQLALFLSAPLALACISLYFRTGKPRRAHRAARIGVLLAFVALLMWALALALWLQSPSG